MKAGIRVQHSRCIFFGSGLSIDLERISHGIVEAAEGDREKDEQAFDWWNKVFYVLYGIGAAVGFVGISLGQDEEQARRCLEPKLSFS